jgi:hypothetical protein
VPTWHDFRRNNEGDPGDDDEETARQVGLEQDRCPASDQLDLEFKEDCEQSSLLSKNLCTYVWLIPNLNFMVDRYKLSAKNLEFFLKTNVLIFLA